MFPIIIRTIIVYIAIMAAMRLMGKRQLGELQPAELVTTFLLSNVASLCINEPDLPLLSSLAPIFLIAALEVINSTIAWYWPHYATFLFGKPVTVVRNGEIDYKAMENLRITGSDLAEAMRGKNVFSPKEVSWGVIEPNGKLNIATQTSAPTMLPLIVDSILYHDNLEAMNLTYAWLIQYLKSANVEFHDVILFLYDGQESILLTKKTAPKGGPIKQNN